ncbi:MAG: sulfatase-like hydrolase/transferase [Bacteroides sp.]|nr:sulfatase-like hydrolase/transferase [Bacteroides sp.]
MMRQVAARLVSAYAALLLVMVVLRPPFILAYTPAGAASWAAMWHGLSMDACVAAYLCIVPGLLCITGAITGFTKTIRRIVIAYFAICALLISAVAAIDFVLYGHWGFRIDSTPFFYFASSPSAAMASATPGEIAGGTAGWLVMAAAIFALLYFVAVKRFKYPSEAAPSEGRAMRVATAVVLTGALFVPIRGGFTVSTMNPSRAYYSSDMRLNHAAMNPLFSLLYSISHRDDFGRSFRYFPPEEASYIFDEMNATAPADSCVELLAMERPDVYLIIFESASSHLMPVLGGEPIAMRLDSLAREGLLFTRMYASSFRTDRALPAILSALPAQPTESLMKHVAKAEKLPSIAGALAEAGYECSYFYGGDANFTNMLAYLRASGFGSIVSDKDFPMSERASKWGAPDHAVFAKALEHASRESDVPRFNVIQTSSSHEPFDVDYPDPRFPEGPQRAFAYADSCVGAFVDSLRALPSWNRSIVAIVPDHYGCYPPRPESIESRHTVPFIITGGALKARGKCIDTICSQTDIAATLLAQLGLDHSRFPFSRNICNVAPAAAYAFYSEPDQAALTTIEGTTVLDVATDATTGAQPNRLKAYLQELYTYLGNL